MSKRPSHQRPFSGTRQTTSRSTPTPSARRYPEHYGAIRTNRSDLSQHPHLFTSERRRVASEAEISQRGYQDAQLPSTRTLRNKLNELGYRLRKVRKCQPLKKIPETDAIFEAVHRVNQAADRDEGVLRISLDTKATVKVGPFSRGGYSRQGATACDHDFQAQTTLTPLRILLPQTGNSHVWYGRKQSDGGLHGGPA